MTKMKKVLKGTCIAAAATAGAYLTTGAVIYAGALSRWGYINSKPEEILNEDYNMKKYLNNEYFRKADDWFVASDPTETKLINVKADGSIVYDRKTVTEAELQVILSRIEQQSGRETAIFLRGDKNVNYGAVINVMRVIRGAGFRNVNLVMQEEAN